MGRLNLGQKIAVLAGLGVGLFVFGRWVTHLGIHGVWVAYAPLAPHRDELPSFGGLHPWARLLIWLGLILVWTLSAVVLLRSEADSPS